MPSFTIALCGTTESLWIAKTVEGRIPIFWIIDSIEQGPSNSNSVLTPSLRIPISMYRGRGITLMTSAHQRAINCRDRIAWYRGGFEIHCPLDARVQISLSAPNEHRSLARFRTQSIHSACSKPAPISHQSTKPKGVWTRRELGITQQYNRYRRRFKSTSRRHLKKSVHYNW